VTGFEDSLENIDENEEIVCKKLATLRSLQKQNESRDTVN
jgi:hypothetical protein